MGMTDLIPEKYLCFHCDQPRCDFTDMFGEPWHWHCFTEPRDGFDNG
jgi:hypothetical protein